MEFLGGLFICWLLYWVFGGGKEKHEKEEAEKAYQEALSKLSIDPSNQELRLNATVLGRKYSELSRDKNGQSALSDSALKNEINIACNQVQPKHKSASEASVDMRLKTLQELKQQGLIDDHEYHSRRKDILNSI